MGTAPIPEDLRSEASPPALGMRLSSRLSFMVDTTGYRQAPRRCGCLLARHQLGCHCRRAAEESSTQSKLGDAWRPKAQEGGGFDETEAPLAASPAYESASVLGLPYS